MGAMSFDHAALLPEEERHCDGSIADFDSVDGV